MKMHSRLFAVLMSLTIVLTFMPALAFADTQEKQIEIPEIEFEGDSYESKTPLDNDALFEEYVDSVFGFDTPGQSLAKRRVRLTGVNQACYEILKTEIAAVAAGSRTSTIFEVTVDDLKLEKNGWTAADLGVDAIVVDDAISEEAANALWAIVSPDLEAILNALLADCPYELYWFDKTAMTKLDGGSVGASFIDGEWVLKLSSGYNFSFNVAEGYAADQYEIDTTKIDRVNRAVSRAAEIVEDNRGKTDPEKLSSYKDAICDLVSYDYDAAEGDVPFGDPWQLVSVFDDDTGTNVVCEGYSKAFQYLCNLTDFEDDISSIIVNGTMRGGTGEGPHMWNIVTMEDGKNYLVDVTNCDAESIGAPDQLFLAGYKTGSVSEGYTFSCNGVNVRYTYDESILNDYDSELIIANRDYGVEEGDSLSINEEIFPDNTVRQYVSDHFDSDQNGQLSFAEIRNAREIHIVDEQISTLEGLENFHYLRTLELQNNGLVEIDVSSFRNLTLLWIANNHNLEHLDVSNNTKLQNLAVISSQIKNIDIRNNEKLSQLVLSMGELTELDVSNNSALLYLDISSNNISEFDTGRLPNLLSYNCQNNPITTIDVSNNLELKELICQVCKIRELDVSKNSNLESLWCSACGLHEIDLSGNPELRTLFCADNCLTGLDISNNTKLTDLRAGGNIVEVGNVEEIDLNGFTDFDSSRASNWDGAEYDAKNNKLINIHSKFVTYEYDCGNGFSMDVTLQCFADGVQLNSANFPDNAFRQYISDEFDSDGNGILSTAELGAIENINCDNGYKGELIENLDGIEYFPRLTNLYLRNNDLKCVEIKSSHRLLNLMLSNNPNLRTVDIGYQPELSYIDFYNCEKLLKLDLSKCSSDLKGGAGIYLYITGCNDLQQLILPGAIENVGSGNDYRDAITIRNCPALRQVVFVGDAPVFAEDAFETLDNVTVYYPEDNLSWNDDIQKDYGGQNISWQAGSLDEASADIEIHNLIHHPESEATCTEKGKTEYWECTDCHKLFEDIKATKVIDASQTEIPALGHDWGEWVTVTEPTEEAEGLETRTCSRCGEEESLAIPALLHTHDLQWTAAKDATCTENGNIEYWTCSKCGRLYSDSEGKKEIRIEGTIVTATGHTETVIAGKDATCTETGLTEGKKCSTCGEILVAQTEIPALGHDYKTVSGTSIAATCETEGKEADQKCTRCDSEIPGKTIAALGHDFGDWSVTTAATCTEDGEEQRVCSRDKTHVEKRVIKAAGHTEVAIPGKDASCTEVGLTEGKKCSVCGEILLPQEEIPALGHAWSEWTTVTEPTEEAEGLEKRICGICDAEESRTIPVLTHVHDPQRVDAKDATCTTDGNIEYWTCSKCGRFFIDEKAENEVNEEDVIVKALGHTEEILPAVDPTYTETGLTEGKKCSVCGEIMVPQEEIPMLERTSIEGATVSGIKTKVYTGKTLTQAPTVVLGDRTLKAGTDYELTYSKNKNVGTATVTITGVNAYKDSISKTFKINPKATSMVSASALSKGFTAKWKKLTTQTTGYQLQYSTSSTFKSGNKTVTITKNSTVTKKVTKLKAKKKYYVRVRTYKKVSGKTYYSAWSGKKAVTTKK